MVKIKMSMTARLKLLDFLAPETGRRARLRLLEKLQNDLSIGTEEGKLVEIEQVFLDNGNVSSTFGAIQNDPMKEIEVGEVYLQIICQRLKEIEASHDGLTQQQVELYDLFYKEILKMDGETAENL